VRSDCLALEWQPGDRFDDESGKDETCVGVLATVAWVERQRGLGGEAEQVRRRERSVTLAEHRRADAVVDAVVGQSAGVIEQLRKGDLGDRRSPR
jgi:hypothetical protein